MAIEKTIILKADTSKATADIKKLDDGVKGVNKSSKGAKKGLGGMSGATKMLGTAFKALGIGLIIAAFMKLKDIFSGNIETARMFERVMSQASAAFDVIRDRTENFIKALIKLKNPFKAFKEAFTGTTAEIRDEVKAMGELTDALQKVRDDERAMVVERAAANKIIAESRLLAEDETKTMQERLVALKAAVAEEQRVAQLELDTQTNKVNALQAVVDLGKSSEEDLIALEAEKGRLIDLQTASILKQKRVVTEIVTFEKQIATERTNQEKKKQKEADDKLKADEKEAAALQVKTEKELELLRTSQLTKQEIELEAIDTKYTKLLELADKYNQDTTELTQAYNEAVLESQAKFAEEEQKIIDQKESERQRLLDKEIADAEKLTAIEKAEADKKLQIAEAEKQAKIALANVGFQAVQQLAGEGTKAAKAAAMASILLNTGVAVVGAIKSAQSMPFPLNLGAIATGVGAVLTGVASAKSLLSKVPGGGTDVPEPDVPDVSGGGEDAGGMGAFETPNLEGINQPSVGGGGTTVQAFVVENDISNAQALQEELDIQATL